MRSRGDIKCAIAEVDVADIGDVSRNPGPSVLTTAVCKGGDHSRGDLHACDLVPSFGKGERDASGPYSGLEERRDVGRRQSRAQVVEGLAEPCRTGRPRHVVAIRDRVEEGRTSPCELGILAKTVAGSIEFVEHASHRPGPLNESLPQRLAVTA
jgi:hypothetical protein